MRFSHTAALSLLYQVPLNIMKNRHIFFIGIGGIGVSGIACLALKRGDRVSGSDIKESSITDKLKTLGAKVFIGHDASNISGADLVVFSSAIADSNPELMAARKSKIPVKRRAEFLSELMTDKKVIAVTGAHGKTTTSSLSAKLLQKAGLNPTVAVGGILHEDGQNAQLGSSAYFVAEADESDGSFLCYAPDISIITNIDFEHMDFYKSFERLLESFSAFIKNTKDKGLVVYFKEDEVLRSLVESSGVRSVSFGFTDEADLYPKDIKLQQCRLSFSCMAKEKCLGVVCANLMGRHNILNVLSVIALGLELGISFDIIKTALADFKGVKRRFQVKYEDKDIFVVDDYAHHPTEIAATIEAAKLCSRKRLLVVFQPHRFSRTKLLMEKFAASFVKSDHVIVTDIYAAGEEPIEGINAQYISELIKRDAKVCAEYVPKSDILGYLNSSLRQDDMVLFLGAGDITKVSDEFVERVQKKS